MLRIVFMGTAELAVPSLRALTGSADFQLLAVVTQPDRPKGRSLHVQPSAVKIAAQELGLPVLQPARARDAALLQELRDFSLDLIALAAYGQLLPPALLDLPRFGCLNVHTSLLPKYRGASPIQSAILNDEPETGVTIMKMDPGLDTGDVLAQAATPIAPEDDAQSLHDRLAQLGARLLLDTISGYVSGGIVPRPQPAEGVSFAPKISKEAGRLDWTQPARALWNRVRAFKPWPGAFTKLPAPDARVIKLWNVEPVAESGGEPGQIIQADRHGIVVGCGTGALRILSLQREGGRRMEAQAFLAGHPLQPGDRLS
jgi:methionyl-tRNA formyltransferase